ncbi:hypothetical protein TTHERM_00361870 (macronuclear) [Tetrahymena thermophila SB210]|uniref:Uncharacterized protein n=1 Tax=Tetrahymena thermophila (strain SB210) TaxID=312017 RepID=Q22PF7_TETTS|nr:hypothetical protein TTHERM_00361870 [Tetrahymena thermophila SB210]EAR87152.2 hypothetical protein TTHERM_00361870 [Tetrahymena thermophila SB210]|eukprot:XP_001007397.2 hypothetical protein TTHERM_00361870 [Tetrahymena thermophila SB210]
MSRSFEANCSELIKFNYKERKFLLQEIQFGKDIDLYCQANANLLNILNSHNSENSSENFYQLSSKITIEEDCSAFFKQIQQQYKTIDRLLQRKLHVLQNLKMKGVERYNQWQFTKDIKVEVNNQILHEQNILLLKDANIQIEEINPQNKLIEHEFQIIIMNPFKVNLIKLQNIFLDNLNALFFIIVGCRSRNYSVKSNISDLYVLKKELPDINIQIFQLQLTLSAAFNHINMDQNECCYCYDLCDPGSDGYSRVLLDLNTYFSKLRNLKLDFSSLEKFERVIGFVDFDIKLNCEKSQLKIYCNSNINFFRDDRPNMLRLSQELNDNFIDFDENFIAITNFLSSDLLFVDKQYEIIVEQQDQLIMRLVIVNNLQINKYFNLSLYKLMVDLFID